MDKAVALANNDVVFLAWSYEQKIEECLGFAVARIEADGTRTVLPAWVGFDGEENPEWQPKDTEVWPVQKFAWRDLTATGGQTCSYEIVPRVGEPGELASLDARRLRTNEVTLTPTCSAHVSAYFNRGILSTQALAHVLAKDVKGELEGKKLFEHMGEELLKHIKDPDDPVRKALAGQIVEALTLLLGAAAKDGSRCHAALYELNDPELIEALDDPAHVSIVLANAGSTEEPDATNGDARVRLHDHGVDVTDRMMPKGHIGHDKFVVKLAPDGTPFAVLTGSTNWTYTGVCGQVNNAILLDDETLATAYLDFWHRLKSESPSGAAGSATQSAKFRSTNNRPHHSHVDDAEVTLWFSPNTEEDEKPDENPPRPADMAEVFERIGAARSAVFFLLFQPGSPSILDAILDAQEADPALFVRGAATNVGAIVNYETELFHRTGERAQVAAASALGDPFGPLWAELLKAPGGHAIIHDKVVVIDPLSSDCTVITGSHNLGYRASYTNDENLLIIKGHQQLARAYATHVIDVYDHYRWRWKTRNWHHAAAGGDNSGGLDGTDAWQSKYFSDPVVEAERRFWV
jgi:hypothetical protein